MSNNDNLVEILLEEYSVCNNKAHSYMSVCWQIGAILISASLIMIGLSIQLFPRLIGVLLILVSIITLSLWYKIYQRFNWICKRAFDRAKAIEAFFVQNNKQLKDLKYGKAQTEMINSWITSLDDTGISIPKTITFLKNFVLALLSVYILTFIIYIVFHLLVN